jgi:hypothetical protein
MFSVLLRFINSFRFWHELAQLFEAKWMHIKFKSPNPNPFYLSFPSDYSETLIDSLELHFLFGASIPVPQLACK